MSKVFIQNGTGSTATLENAHNEKIPIYDTLQDAEADLANLEENQLGATNEMVTNRDFSAIVARMTSLDWTNAVQIPNTTVCAGWTNNLGRGMIIVDLWPKTDTGNEWLQFLVNGFVVGSGKRKNDSSIIVTIQYQAPTVNGDTYLIKLSNGSLSDCFGNFYFVPFNS